ncbi:hypothetical protein VNI00_014678 [Paramarasmius palmivorus]|uniref:F-box domain-containing protein n=1 Tax=Paramarasmius palmivorus TaxID=297713 RepID=A0AAW0BVH7_9AGAR
MTRVDTEQDSLPESPRTTLPCPLEIQDRIIDFGHNNDSFLFACSLVCKSWLPAARYHIFGKRPRPYQGSTRNRIVALCHLLDQPYCTIATYIKHLRVVTRHDGSNYYYDRKSRQLEVISMSLAKHSALRLNALDLDVGIDDLEELSGVKNLSSLTSLNLCVRIDGYNKTDLSSDIIQVFMLMSEMKELESLTLKIAYDEYGQGSIPVHAPQPGAFTKLSFQKLRKLTLRSAVYLLPWLMDQSLVYAPELTYVFLHINHDNSVDCAVLQQFLDTVCSRRVENLILRSAGSELPGELLVCLLA